MLGVLFIPIKLVVKGVVSEHFPQYMAMNSGGSIRPSSPTGPSQHSQYPLKQVQVEVLKQVLVKVLQDQDFDQVFRLNYLSIKLVLLLHLNLTYPINQVNMLKLTLLSN